MIPTYSHEEALRDFTDDYREFFNSAVISFLTGTADEIKDLRASINVMYEALLEVANLPDVDADNRSVIVDTALAKLNLYRIYRNDAM